MSFQLSSVGVPSYTTPATKQANSTTPTTVSTNTSTDSVTLTSTQTTALTYTDPRNKTETTAADLEKMLAESDRQVEAFMGVLRTMLNQQGLAIDKVVKGEQKLTADPATIEQAKADVSTDGEFGVRKTAERILNFAKLGIGNDPSKIETFRAAIQKGFDEAQSILGGTLPEISQQTHKAIMDELDRWAANGIPEGAVSLSTAESTQTTQSTQTKGTTTT